MNRQLTQATLFEFDLNFKRTGVFPSTRYQGSKSKLVDWIKYYTQDLKFDSVLDAFGGTGSVAYMYKKLGKRIFYNDTLKFNYYIGLALIENNSVILDDEDVDFILSKDYRIKYPTFIQDTFQDIYFANEENAWLDMVVINIERLTNVYKRAIAFYALFQACIIKRPYNLFHRKNLYIRLANVERSFGNKKTWDTSFEEHFRNFVMMANRAVFDNHRENKVYCSDIFDLKIHSAAGLVYIDTPYISKKGFGVNYFEFYHFLEGLTDYNNWEKKIDYKSKHKRMLSEENIWCDKKRITSAFGGLFNKYKDSIIVISYRDDGIPSVAELEEMLRNTKDSVETKKIDYKYVLSNVQSKEILLIGK